MSRTQVLSGIALALICVGLIGPANARGENPAPGDTFVVRLVHPERQAANVITLFDGARVSHPAAALAAWKRAAREPHALGKPLEAVIAMFNPEMAREWQVLHEAEIRIDVRATDGVARWYAIVPHDDGTISAGITAMRMTDGAAEAPVALAGNEIAVERLGPAGAMLSARLADMLLVAASRDELVRAIDRIKAVPPVAPAREARQFSTVVGSENTVDSGLVFELDPRRLTPGVGTTTYRRCAAFFQGLGCRWIGGNVALRDDKLALDVTTLRERAASASPAPPAIVDRDWLTWLPARGAMGAISVAFGRGPAFLDSAFALADRIERADPSRGNVAPLRTRFNLLAAAAGARPEVDLWPHLRGLTACVIADPDQPGRPAGALAVLHTDADSSAVRLATDVLPRLGTLLTGKKPGGEPVREAPAVRPAGGAPGGDTFRLGTVGARSLLIFRHGRDVVIAWGDDALAASIEAAREPGRSIAPLCTDWARQGKQAPQRLGVIWPARCWPAARGMDTNTPEWQVLAQDPPAVWWGWTGPADAHDSIQYSGLRQRVHQFVDRLRLDPSPLR